MLLIGLCFTALGIAIASKMEDMHGFQLIMNFVIFPIFGLSGAVFPINSLPSWLRTFTLFDPLTYGVEGVRYGLLGTSYIDPVQSALVLGGVTVVMILIGAYLFRKIKI
jgi:ABC-2 type transport system permease protein